MKTSLKVWLSFIGIILAYSFYLSYTTFMVENEFKNAPIVIEDCADSNITGLVYSLRNYPQNWKTTNYKLTHRSGIMIWIANEDYGLDIGTDGDTNKYEMTDQCRAILYSATQNWRKNYLSNYMRGKNGV